MSARHRTVDRTTFYFPPQAAARLWSIKRLSHHDNNADVIRAALMAYDELLELVYAGFTFLVRERHTGKEHVYSPYRRFDYEGFKKLKTVSAPQDAEQTPKNFVFKADSAEKLDSIRKRSYLQSNADVIRAALAAYDELLRICEVGDDVLLVDREGREHAYTPYGPVRREMLGLPTEAGLAVTKSLKSPSAPNVPVLGFAGRSQRLLK